MKSKLFTKRNNKILQIISLMITFSGSSLGQERFLLTQEDLPDYELKSQSIYWADSDHQVKYAIEQNWTGHDSSNYLYLKYYEYNGEYTAIQEMSDLSGSFAGIYIFGFPSGEIKGNSSWTYLERDAAFIQKWNVGVQIFVPYDGVNSNKSLIESVTDKLLVKISDSISAEYLLKDTVLKMHQVPIVDYNQIIGAAIETIASNGFSEYKVEDSKWIFNTDSLVMGVRKQWSGENSFFSIDVCEFSSVDDAQQAAEQNANIKRSPFFLIDDEASLEQAIEHWNYYWSVNDTIKYISVVGRTGKYAIHFYFFDDYGIDIELFKQVILATAQMGTGISDNGINAIKVYPNPATNFFTITSPTGISGKYFLVISDIRGRQVIIKNIELSGSFLLNISGLTQGVYFITLQNDSMRVSKKIIVR